MLPSDSTFASVKVSLYITPEMREEVLEFAKANGLDSVSSVHRLALARLLGLPTPRQAKVGRPRQGTVR